MQAIRVLTGENYYGRSPFQLPWDAVIGAGWRAQEMGGAAACMVYGVVALLLVPTFCLSVWIETIVSAPVLGRPSSEVRLPIRKANLLSYSLLVLFMMWLGVMAFMDADKHGERFGQRRTEWSQSRNVRSNMRLRQGRGRGGGRPTGLQTRP
jgi:hypothetical protein